MAHKSNVKRSPSSSSTIHSAAQPPCNKRKIEDCSLQSVLLTHTTPNSTPVSTESDGYAQNVELYGAKMKDEDMSHLMVADETSGLWVGPMDPRCFLERFVPQVDVNAARPNFCSDTFAAILDASDQSEMLGQFIEALSPFAPQLRLVATHSLPDTCRDGIEVSISVYPVTEANIRKTDFSRMEIPMGLVYKEKYDPFSDSGGKDEKGNPSRFPFERDGFKYMVKRGQIGSYLSALAGAQFRLHIFAVFICGKWARLIRWDPNGAIVTSRFAYAEEDHLVEFFWRYSHTPPDDPMRGNDPTVKALPLEATVQTSEEKAARIELEEANSTNHREFRTMVIPDRDTNEEYLFLISYPPKYINRSPFGRATRPMLAFDLDKNVMVFAKDYWRSVAGDAEKEGDIYKLLHEAAVPHIPSFGKGNDVRDHTTLTDITKSEDWALPCAKMVAHSHYRMSLEEIGRPSNEFKSSHELVTAVADAMEAHEVAFHDASILHRDISAGNILITKDGRGMLIDWDLSLNLNSLQDKARKPGRMGTWQFLSAFLLDDLEHIHDMLDDAESAFYVILWNMVKYTPHNRTDRLSWLMKLFDDISAVSCTSLKRDFLCCTNKVISFEGRPHLDNLLRELSALLNTRYEHSIGPSLRKFLETEEAAKEMPMNYVIRERRLRERFWLVKTMRKHLEPRCEWPEVDGAHKNPDTEAEIWQSIFKLRDHLM